MDLDYGMDAPAAKVAGKEEEQLVSSSDRDMLLDRPLEDASNSTSRVYLADSRPNGEGLYSVDPLEEVRAAAPLLSHTNPN